MLDEDQLRRRIATNQETFDRLVERVQHTAERRPAQAVALAQATAEFAWFNHTGWFASAALEGVVRDVGQALTRKETAGPQRTLHVVTQMYQTGGSTQAIASWTDEMSDRSHEIVVTGQRSVPIPAKIRARLGERVTATRLDTSPGSLLHRAARLRRLATSADLVLIHAHPYDVVPSLAFANRHGLPPVVYIDHADHVFWLGVTAVDYVMSMRYSGRDLALERRGLTKERSLVGNRPLAVRTRTMDRGTAKSLWGVLAEDVLLVTAADGSKFHGSDGPHLVDLIEPALRARPGLRWLIAGPSAESEPWASLAARTEGRARAVGSLPDMSTLHQAADIYLDSFPFASLTSMLESGAYANPIVTFRGHPQSCSVYGSDSPGVDEVMFRPQSPPDLLATILGLVDDPDLRRLRGRATADSVVSSHTGSGWRTEMGRMYELPTQRSGQLGTPRRDVEAVDLLAASVQASNPFSRSVDSTVVGHLGVMPFRDRLSSWREARAADRSVGLKALAPEWVVAALRARSRH